jgi:hypothetical protein
VHQKSGAGLRIEYKFIHQSKQCIKTVYRKIFDQSEISAPTVGAGLCIKA